jgi:type VI secretion system protein ImpJ
MLSARDIPAAIQWHEGMMLAPPHFQQMAARIDQLVAYNAAAISPFHWGLLQFQLDRVTLISGQFRVLELEAVMPDGLIVHYSAADPGGLEADLTPHIDPIAQPTLTVHLCVPAAKPGMAASPGDLPRYASVEGPLVRDECDGEGEIRIPRLKPRLSLMVTTSPGQKPPQKYVSIPLARVVYQHEAFALADFAPPTLALAPQSLLGRMGADLARRIREKALFLAERAGSPAAIGNNRAVQETLSEIRGLVAVLPPLEALLAAGVCHPFQVYLALCQVAGHMAGVGTGPVPPTLSRYDHDDALVAFAEIRDLLLRMLGRIKEAAAPMAFAVQAGKFRLHIEPSWLRRKLIVGVRGAVGMSEADVVAWMSRSLIASETLMEKLWEMRVKGASREPMDPSTELDISPGRGVILFLIDNDKNFILGNEMLEIWNSDQSGARARIAEIVLYVQS